MKTKQCKYCKGVFGNHHWWCKTPKVGHEPTCATQAPVKDHGHLGCTCNKNLPCPWCKSLPEVDEMEKAYCLNPTCVLYRFEMTVDDWNGRK